MENPEGRQVPLTHNQIIGRLSRQPLFRQHHYYIPKMSINIASTTFGHAS